MALPVGNRPKRTARTELAWAVERAARIRLCAELVQAAGRVVIVCRRPADATRLAGELSRHGVPAAAVEHRDFSAPHIRAQVVTDETALGCSRNAARCVIHYDPAAGVRRHRRRVDLLAAPEALVVTFVVPERLAEARILLADLDRSDVLTGPDLAGAREALAAARDAAQAALASADRGVSRSVLHHLAAPARHARAVAVRVLRPRRASIAALGTADDTYRRQAS